MTSRPPRSGRYHATLLALEPRMMFDAAAVVTAQDTVADMATDRTADRAVGRAAPADGHGVGEGDAAIPASHDLAMPIEGLVTKSLGAGPSPREIVFIDTAVADYRQLAAEWAGRGEVVLINGTADGLDQIRASLAGRSDLSAIHLVGHGAQGVLWLGTTRIDAAGINGDLAASLGAVGRSLGQGGDILIYGCDFAAGTEGADALAAFAHATGADVAASTDTTGYAARGGDWTLEAHDGAIEAHALASADWVHTLAPNQPVPISVAVGSLTVTDANGTVVFSAANNYNNNAARSPDVGVGAVATWANAATFNGRSVDLKATVVSLTTGDAVQFNRVTGTGTGPDDPTFLLRDLTTGNTPATVQVRWTLVDHATGNPLPADVRFTIADIDGIGGNARSRETVTASTQNLAYFTREAVTNIAFTASLDAIEASGTQDENNPTGATLTPQSAATFDWKDVSAFTLTYTLTNNTVTNQAQFFHDGDADFLYNNPVYVSVPRLDLDADNSTAPGNDARFTFVEDGPAIPVVDADLVVTNPMGPTAIVGASVVLTNHKPGDTLTVGTLPANLSATIGQPTNGRLTVTLSGSGSEADYTAALKAIGFRNGSDTPDTTQRVIEVSFSNNTLTSAIATSRIDVVAVNDAPIAVDDGATTAEDTPATIAVLANDRDPDGDPLTVVAASALHGTVARNADGTITYTPDANYHGPDTISYTIADGRGGTAGATAAVTVTPVNDAPIAADDGATTAEDTPVTIAVLANDRDPDGDPLTVVAASALHGTVVRNADGTITYTPDANYHGADTLSYTIADGRGGTAAATAAITVTPVNDAPRALAIPTSYVVVDGTAVAVSVADAFRDVDGDPLTYAASGLPAGFAIDPATGMVTGTLGRSASQVNGGRYAVTLTATDPAGASATQRVIVTALNPGPVAVDDHAETAEDIPVDIAVLANDRDPDGDPLTVTAASAANGTVVRHADGTLTYTPNADFNGTDTIRYTISDGEGGTAGAEVTVRVAPQRDAPTAQTPPPQTVAEDAALVFTAANGNAITVTNVDGGDLTVTLTAGHGRVTLSSTAGLGFALGDGNADAMMIFTGSVAAINTALDGARFVGDADYHGAADLGITVSRAPIEGEDFQNGGGEAPVIAGAGFGYFDQADVPGWSTTEPDGIIEIESSGFEGVAAREGNQFFELSAEEPATLFQTFRPAAGGAVTVDFSHRGRRGDDTMRLTATDLGSDGQFGTADDRRLFTQDYTTGNADWSDHTATITTAATGNLIRLDFTSVSQAGPRNEGNFLDAVRVTTNAAPLTAARIVPITVTPVADIVADRATTPEDTAVVIDALGNDGFADPARQVVAIDGRPIVAGGPPIAVANGQVAADATGRVTFTPAADYHGTTTFTYTVAAGDSTETATETVVVTPVDDAPIANGTLPDRTASDGIAVSWATADAFRDIDGDALTFAAAGLPAGLAIDPATGLVSGTIDRSASQIAGGRYSVVVTARDGDGLAVVQQFRLDIANPAPVAVDDAAVTHADTAAVVAVLANDRDPDGDRLIVTDAAAARGRVEILGDGSLRYVPPVGFVGRDTVTYAIADGQGGTATAQVTIDVTNDAPTADPVGAVIGRDGQAIDLPIGAGFRDPDGDPLRFSATGLPPGLAIDPATGTITGTIAASASRAGRYAVTVIADDGLGGIASVGFDWIVTNPAPIATDDQAIVVEDTPTTLAPLANDGDPDGDPLAIVAASATHGQVAINPDGTLAYVPDRDFHGQDTIAYTIADGDGGRAGATITVTVTPVNDAPVATPLPPQSSPDGSPVSVPTGPAFGDVDGDALVFTATGLPAGLSIDPATGVIGGTIATAGAYGGPAGDGVYPVTVAATDPSGRSAQAAFLWTVAQTPPVAVDDRATTAEDAAVLIPVLANDRDPDGDPIAIVDAVATNGTVTIRERALLFAPAPDFVGRATITYTIADPAGRRATATVTVDITAVNDAPDARPIAVEPARDAQTISLPVGAFFSDRDGDALRFSATGLPAGLAIDPATGVIAGTIDRAAGGVRGGLYRVVVAATDPAGARTESAFDWTIVNPAPVAADDTATVVEDTPTVIAVLANDGDPDGDPLTVVAASARHGRVAINPDGTLTYTPDRDFAGTDVIVYDIADDNGGRASASVLVTVTPVQDGPAAVPDRVTTAEDTPVVIAVLANDTDPDGDPLTVVAAGAARGSVAIGADGRLIYTPPADFNGVDTVTYTIADGRGGTATATVAVTVAPVNDPPIAPDGRATTAEDRPVVITVLDVATDPDGDPLAIVAAAADRGTVAVRADRTLLYTPPADFNGADTIRYRVSDGQGGVTDARVVVTVTPVNDPPVAVVPPGFAPTGADAAPVAIDTAGLFGDVDGDGLAFSATGLPPGLAIDPVTGAIRGTLGPAASQVGGGVYPIVVTARDAAGATAAAPFTLTVTNPAPIARDAAVSVVEDSSAQIAVLANVVDPDGDTLSLVEARATNGTVAIDPDGTLTYTPNPDFSGADTITYTIADSDGARTTGTVRVTVTPVNDAPIARDDVARTREDTGIVIPILANDRDPDRDPLAVIAVSAVRGTATINRDGTVTYVPAANFAGSDTIRYTIADGQGGTATAIVTVVIDPVNDLPVIPAGAPVDAVGGRPVLIDPLAGASDADGDPLTVVRASAANGRVVVNPDGTLVFAPALGFVGTTTIAVTISDGRGGETIATIVVRVADGRGADIEQLLRIGRVTFLDPSPSLAIVATADGLVRNPLGLLSAAEGIRALGPTAIGANPVGDAVEALRTLRGTAIAADGPIAGEVARLDALRDQRDAGDRLFDRRWGDFLVKGFSGFSAAADRDACVMIESVVRGDAIYLEIRDIAAEGARAPIAHVDLRLADGRRVPEWIKVDPRGLAIIERPADADELHLLVRVTRTDGRTSTTPIVVQGATGEVELDRHHRTHHRAARPLDAALDADAGHTDAATLDRFFQ